jgi:hypothetical protein
MSVLKEIFDYCKTTYNAECKRLNLLSDEINFETDIYGLDFDALTRDIAEEMPNIARPSSADVLILGEKIIFIEFKSLVKTVERYITEDKIKARIDTEWDFDKKLEGSNFTIHYLSQLKKLNFSKLNHKSLREYNREYYVIVDDKIQNNGLQNLALSLEYLSNTLRLKTEKAFQMLEEKIESTISQPKLISHLKIPEFIQVDTNFCNYDIVQP